MDEVDYRRARRLGLEKVYGVEVTAVLPDSPADEAGIRPGDVILSWNGQDIHSRAELSLAVVQSKIGSQATVALVREGQRLKVTVTVGRRTLQPAE
jgi:S1-C subfamily serine protease